MVLPPPFGLTCPLIFSPDSQKLAFAAAAGGKLSVVVDGQAGEQYDGILGAGGQIVFDGPDSLHYLAKENVGGMEEVYLVEEKLE